MLRRIGCGILLVLWSRHASAEPTDPPQGSTPSNGVAAPDADPSQKAPGDRPIEVRVIGAKSDSLPKVPGSGTVLTHKEIDRAQPVDTAEMLRRVPGVQARQEFGGGNRLDVGIRGMDAGRSRRVLMLEDGIPLAINPYSEPDMYFAPNIERYRAIEVVKGSGNILFGPQTLAGTINFVTVSPAERRSAVLDLDVGSFGYTRGLARYGDAAGDARYVVQGLYRRGDGFNAQPFESLDTLAKLAMPTGENGTATLKLGFHRDDAVSTDVGLTSAMYRAAPRQDALAPKNQLVLNRYDVSLTHEQRFSSDTKLKTLLYAYRTDRTWRRQTYTRNLVAGTRYDRAYGDPSVPLGAIAFTNENTVLDRSYDVLGVEPRAEHRMRTGDVRHDWAFGGRMLYETAHYQQRSGGYPETFAGSLDFEEKHRAQGFAAYLQDRIAFTDKLLVTPGIRFEYVTFSRIVLRQAENGAVRDVYQEGTSDAHGVIPGIGLVYGTRQAHVFGGLHRGFAPPRVTSSISARGQTARVNPDESTNYELGTRLSPTKWSHLETTGFLSVFTNQVILNTNPGSDTALVDAGATNLVGAENAGTLRFGELFHWATALDWSARYTYSRSTFRYGANAGHLLPYAPVHTFNSNLDIEHPVGFGGQVAYSFVDRQFTDAESTRVEDVTGRIGPLEPWHLVDATLHYRHKPTRITVRLTAKNALGATYIAARRPEGIHPGAFRQILLGLRWDYDAPPAP